VEVALLAEPLPGLTVVELELELEAEAADELDVDEFDAVPDEPVTAMTVPSVPAPISPTAARRAVRRRAPRRPRSRIFMGVSFLSGLVSSLKPAAWRFLGSPHELGQGRGGA